MARRSSLARRRTCFRWGRTGKRRTDITSLLECARGPLASGIGGSANHVRTSGDLFRWTQSCPRTGGVLHARFKLPPGGDPDKELLTSSKSVKVAARKLALNSLIRVHLERD